MALTVEERTDRRFWQYGASGPCNIVNFDGEDVRGIAFVKNDKQCKTLIEKHNEIVRKLLPPND